MEKPSFISNAFYLERSLFRTNFNFSSEFEIAIVIFGHEKDFFRANSIIDDNRK